MSQIGAHVLAVADESAHSRDSRYGAIAVEIERQRVQVCDLVDGDSSRVRGGGLGHAFIAAMEQASDQTIL